MKPSRYIDHISQNSCWNVKCFQKNIIDKIKTLVTINISFFFRKSYHLCDNVEKYCRARQATDNNTAHAHFMLDA